MWWNVDEESPREKKNNRAAARVHDVDQAATESFGSDAKSGSFKNYEKLEYKTGGRNIIFLWVRKKLTDRAFNLRIIEEYT